MPCNLAARADTKVSNATLAKLLFSNRATLEQALQAWAVKNQIVGNISFRWYGDDECQLHCDRLRLFSIVNSGTGFTAYAGDGDQKTATALAKFLTEVSGLLFQQTIKTALAKKFAVESVQGAPNGALVIKMEV